MRARLPMHQSKTLATPGEILSGLWTELTHQDVPICFAAVVDFLQMDSVPIRSS